MEDFTLGERWTNEQRCEGIATGIVPFGALIIYLLILYAVFPIEKWTIVFKLHTLWACDCTLIQPITFQI